MIAASFAGDAMVTTLDEPGVSSDGLCSLSEAIRFVNNGTSDGSGCAGAYYPETIRFSVTGKVTLAADLPSINPLYGSVAIVGPGSDQLTIDLNGDHRGFVTSSQGVALTLTGVTVTGGASTSLGGMMYVARNDSAIVEDCVITGNSTTSNGGAIAVRGDLTVRRTVINDNHATGKRISGGGGIWSEGGLTLVSSAVFGNTAMTDGGGVFVGADGVAAILNTTLSGNTGRGGGGLAVVNAFGADPGPVARVFSTTISQNTADDAGGVVITGTGGRARLELSRTIVSGNQATVTASPDCNNGDAVSGTIISGGHNLIGIGTRCVLDATATGDALGSAKTPLDARLAALAPNGSALQSHRLLGDSPAIDVVAAASCTDDDDVPLAEDQRGFARPQPGVIGGYVACDIGAHEIGCGDGVTDDTEACDDGAANSDDAPDACRTTCVLPRCGDGVVDEGETCDPGDVLSKTCVDCQLVGTTTDSGTTDTGTTDAGPTDTGELDETEPGCGCASGVGPSAGWLALIGLVSLRRRRVSPRGCA